MLEEADPSLVGCAPFHGDACVGDHHELGDLPVDVLAAVAYDAFPDPVRRRGLLRRLMRDHGMLPAAPSYRTEVDLGRELALDDERAGEVCAAHAESERAAAAGFVEAKNQRRESKLAA